MGESGVTLGQPVFLTFDQLAAVLGKMGELLPPEASFSFNHDAEKAWIVAADGLDLHAIVEQALAQLGQKIETPKARQRAGAADRSVLGA